MHWRQGSRCFQSQQWGWPFTQRREWQIGKYTYVVLCFAEVLWPSLDTNWPPASSHDNLLTVWDISLPESSSIVHACQCSGCLLLCLEISVLSMSSLGAGGCGKLAKCYLQYMWALNLHSHSLIHWIPQFIPLCQSYPMEINFCLFSPTWINLLGFHTHQIYLKQNCRAETGHTGDGWTIIISAYLCEQPWREGNTRGVARLRQRG